MAQTYFKEKKIFLGTNKNSYITTNEVGEIVISTEAGGKAVIGDTGITHASVGGALEPVGGATGVNHGVHTGDAGGVEWLDDFGTYTFTSNQQTSGAPAGTYTFLKINSQDYQNGANILLIPIPTAASINNRVITFSDNSTFDLDSGIVIKHNNIDYNIESQWIDVGGANNVTGNLITAGFNTDYIKVTLTPNGADDPATYPQMWNLHQALSTEGDLVDYWSVSPGRALPGNLLEIYSSDTRNTLFNSKVQITNDLTVSNKVQAGDITIEDDGKFKVGQNGIELIEFRLGNSGKFNIHGNTDSFGGTVNNGPEKLMVNGGEVITGGKFSPIISQDADATTGRLGATPSFFQSSATAQDIPILEYGANQPTDGTGRPLANGTAIEMVELDGGFYGIWKATNPWYVVQETGTANGRTVGDWYIAGDTSADNMFGYQSWGIGQVIFPYVRWGVAMFDAQNPAYVYDVKIKFPSPLDYNSNDQYFGGNVEIDGNIATSTQLDFYVDGSNEMRLEADGDLHVDGSVIATSTTISSDEKLKSNITKYENAIDTINAIKGVSFDWKLNGKKSGGVIAQDVQKVLPELVKEVKDLDGDNTHLAVDYNAIIGVLIEAVKELSEQVNKK